MKIKFTHDYLGQKKDAIAELPDQQAQPLIDTGTAEAVAATPADLEEALGVMHKAMNQQLESAAQRITNQVIDQVSRGLKGIRPSLVIGPDRAELDPTGGQE